jgi:hypothetical protein
MATEHAVRIARNLIDRHGLRAGAFAQAQLQEARLSGDTAAVEQWTAVAAATDELRRTGRKAAPPTRH